MKSNFREWTFDKIDAAFDTKQVWKMSILNEWMGFEHHTSEYEIRLLTEIKELFALGGDDWNETELENKIISPIIVFSRIDNEEFSYFLEREMEATIGDYELSGKVDGMVATGFRNPRKPFFCLNEYKRGTDPNGDPKGQALIAMLVAQALNENKKPVFGCYIIGRHWNFMVLEGKNYAISDSFDCANDEIFDIFRVLKGLRFHIERLLA